MPIPKLQKKLRTNKSWSGRPSSSARRSYNAPIKKSYNNYRRGDNKILALFWQIITNKKFLKYVAMSGAVIFVALSIWVLLLSRNLPDPNKLIDRQISESTKIYDRTGKTILYEIFGDEKRTLVNIDQIPNYVKWATVSIEDKNFYKHGGFSISAIFRTVITDIFTGKRAGASTLTQQLVKNAILTSEKTITRKVKELILSYRIEKKFSKDQILQMYLNEIPYGSTAYGVEAASQRFFGKSVKDVTLPEAAILAALPQAPSRYSPYGDHKDLLIARQQYILDIMAEQGYISKEEAEAAKKVEVAFKPQGQNMIAPHFVMYVKEMLSDKYGETAVESGGLKIYTTLDVDKQKIAEDSIGQFADKNKEKYGAWNASLVSIDPKTGEVLAMVGSKNYFGESEPAGCVSGKNCKFEPKDNVSIRLRQPGSSLKPLVYATAFNKGYTPDTILYDVVTNFSTDEKSQYQPLNYNLKENGPIAMKKALAGSLNIPAVKALYLAGIDSVIDLAKAFGYTSLNDKDKLGLSLVLGGGEVKLLEHVNAYGVFAREGESHSVSFILKVVDKNGKVLEEEKPKAKTVLDANVCREINEAISNNDNRAYVFGAVNWLTLPDRPVAAKTGTTNDFKDAWTIGYTPSLVAGVWVGNNNGSAMNSGADGSAAAAPIWNAFMKKALEGTPIENFNAPEKKLTGKPVLDGQDVGKLKVKIDRASGLLATEYTPASFIEEKIYDEPHSILYFIEKNDPLGSIPKNPSQDPQFVSWETGVRAWAEKQGMVASAPPTAYDNLHTPENRPSVSIQLPSKNQVISSNKIKTKISASAPRGINKINYYIDGGLISSGQSQELELTLPALPAGYHEFIAEACDDIDNCAQNKVEFNLTKNLSSNNNFSAEINSLSNGSIINQIDFPLPIGVSLSGVENIKKIELYAQSSLETKYITTSSLLTSNNTSLVWNIKPDKGAYSLFLKVYSWNNQEKESGKITLNIN